jgi:uncharacterized protein YuzE
MEIKYFQDTDTLLINFTNNDIVETKNINENVLAEFDEFGNMVSLTLEHAKNITNINDLSYQQLTSA